VRPDPSAGPSGSENGVAADPGLRQGRTVQSPTLTDGTVALRPHRADDVHAVVEQATDACTTRWTTVPSPYTAAMAADWVASRERAWATGTGELTFVVELAGRFAGQVGLRPDGEGAAEIGFGLSAWARGRGAMARAVRLTLAWGFEDLGLEVVHWHAQVGNWASRRVAWACGFTVEGQVRGLLSQRGERRDAWVGSIQPADDMRPSTRWLDVPELRGEAVVLRRHRDEDALRIAEACAADSTQRWLPALPAPYTILDAATYLAGREEQHAQGEGVYWAVADPCEGRLLGAIGLMALNTSGRSGEIGYWVHPDARGRGVAVEAVRLAARHGLLPAEDGGLGLSRVLIRVAEGNEASRRVALGAGFRQVGRDRRAERLRDGSTPDFLRFDLLPEELPEPR
jgi:RimJ/RimL family protein N-acetyltransferase